ESRAVAFELGVADAVDFAEGAWALRTMGGELGQGAVREYDVGGNLLFLRKLRAQRLQGIEQRGIRVADDRRRRGSLAVALGPLGRRPRRHVLAQLDRGLTFEHTPAFVGDPPAAVLHE